MNTNDKQARRIAKLLDASTEDLTLEQRMRLTGARQLALSRYRAEAAPELAPAWAVTVSRVTERRVFGVSYVIPVAALVLGLVGITYIHNGAGFSNDVADIDAGLLTDDLPISAYLDTGFDSWLKRSPR